MARYHLNKQGNPGECSAQLGACPFGAAAEHYETPEEARAGFELKQGGSFKSVAFVNEVPVPEKFYHLTKASSLTAITSSELTPSIGERSEELKEETPRVYLFDSKESAEDALGGWLGECFDEDEELVLLSISAEAVQNPVPSFEDPEGSWEWTTELPVRGSSLHLEPERY